MSSLKLLVFGATGQVARELARLAGPGLAIETLDRAAADLAHPGACAARIAQTDAQAVINAAAYTAVDRAETEEALALRINGAAPGEMARACAARGLPFLHVSTDYVFDGSGTAPHLPGDPAAPLNAYGRSKWAGEEAVRAAGGVHAILRTSWVFSAHGANFVKTMLRLSESRDSLDIVADQIGGPTPAAAIATALVAMARSLVAGGETDPDAGNEDGKRGGTYHLAGAPAVSWARFACETFALAGRSVAVREIPTSAYPTPAARPLNSRLDGASLRADFGIAPADWRAGLRDVLSELGVDV